MARVDFRQAASDIRAALADPKTLLQALGIKYRGTASLSFCCPVHNEKNPSASARRGQDGSAQWRCFGCQAAGDALSLIAAARGLSTRGADFPALLAVGAELAGLNQLADAIRNGKPAPEYARPSPPPPEPERGYPLPEELRALWDLCVPPASDADTCRFLVQRGKRLIDPDKCLGRVIPLDAQLPRWAYHGKRPWTELGYRLLLPTFDFLGIWRSVRAVNILRPPGLPKTRSPTGHVTAGLCLANRAAVEFLRVPRVVNPLVIVEGETDFMSASYALHIPIIGIGSGSWTSDWGRRVPSGSTVRVAVDDDLAGHLYVKSIRDSLNSCHVDPWGLSAAQATSENP